MNSVRKNILSVGECHFNYELAQAVLNFLTKEINETTIEDKHCRNNIECVKFLNKVIKEYKYFSYIIGVIDIEDRSFSPEKAERLEKFLDKLSKKENNYEINIYNSIICKIIIKNNFLILLLLLNGGAESAVEKLINKDIISKKYKKYLNDPRKRRHIFKKAKYIRARRKIIQDIIKIINDQCYNKILIQITNNSTPRLF